MAIEITDLYGIEWTVNQGAPVGEPVEDLNYFGGVVPPTEFTWNDEQARLVGGPEELTGYYVQGRVFLDTRTKVLTDPDPLADPPDPGGEIVSDDVARTYPAVSVTSMTITTSEEDNWTDTSNPAKPRQWGGPILYRFNPTEPYASSGGPIQVGIKDNRAIVSGFVFNEATLPATRINGDDTFYIALDTGTGFVWADAQTGGGSYQWMKSGIAKDPGQINTTPYATVNDLPEDAEDGQWAIVNNSTYGTVYAKDGTGWMNIGPVQGPGPIVSIPDDEEKTYVSGYIYSLVFDRSDFKYVPRLSGGTQGTYQGEVSIDVTGWFPDSPYDPERDIYPMDSVTAVKPDDRELVSITYTVTLTTDLYTGSCTIVQDVYQPTSSWGDLINQLLQQTYFYWGIYH